MGKDGDLEENVGHEGAEFCQAYESPAFFAKKLEVSWFHFQSSTKSSESANENSSPIPVHRMPFLHRTLSFHRRGKRADLSESHVIKTPVSAWTEQPKTNEEDIEEQNSTIKSRKKKDLLFKLFKHRVARYNEALLSSPRRATRASSSLHNTSTKQSPAEHRSQCVLEVEGNLSPDSPSCKNENGKRTLVPQSREEIDVTRLSLSYRESRIDENLQLKKRWRGLNQGQNDAGRNDDVNNDEKKGTFDVVDDRTSEASPSCVQGSPFEERTLLDELERDGRCGSKTSPVSSLSSRSATNQHLSMPSVPRESSAPQSKAFFHYLYMDKNNVPACLFEVQENRRCPFCFLDAVTDSGLLMHCKSTHGDPLSFEAVRSEDNTFHIVVVVDRSKSDPASGHLDDFIFVRSTHSVRAPDIAVVKKATIGFVAREKRANLLQGKPTKHLSLPTHFPADKIPKRQYYHSRTNLPMLDGDWDRDSDDEPDDSWLHTMSNELLDDFEDISPKEKDFMKIWNYFIKSHTITSDEALPHLCLLFIKSYIADLKELDLRQNLLLHLFNLWDSGLVSSAHIHSCMVKYDST